MCTYTHMNIYAQWNVIQLKKKEILPYATVWMKLENIMLSEITQSQDKFYIIPLT